MKLLKLNVVLAAIDRDDMSSAVLQGAHELAVAAGARLHVINVVRPEDERRVPRNGDIDADLERLLQQAGLSASEVAIHVLAGDPAPEIRSLATTVGADVIVLGRLHDRGRKEPLGGTAMRVVTNSGAPCLVLPGTMVLPLERVLVPVDLSETARGALVLALSWASALRGAEKSAGSTTNESAKLTALLIDQDGRAGRNASTSLDDELQRLRRDAGSWASVAVDGVTVRRDDVAASIAAYAGDHQSDLIVMGTRGLGADAERRLGSVSERVMKQVNVPILLVPPAVWSSDGNRNP